MRGLGGAWAYSRRVRCEAEKFCKRPSVGALNRGEIASGGWHAQSLRWAWRTSRAARPRPSKTPGRATRFSPDLAQPTSSRAPRKVLSLCADRSAQRTLRKTPVARHRPTALGATRRIASQRSRTSSRALTKNRNAALASSGGPAYSIPVAGNVRAAGPVGHGDLDRSG